MTESRKITYQGSGPFVRTLVQVLEEEGVTVTVRRDGPYVGEHRDPRRMGDSVHATLVALGPMEAIRAGVYTFRQRFADQAMVRIEGDDPAAGLPPTQGRHRA